ncbi:putative glucosylceramidase 4 [Homalodisca vitripennis]|uniref:putative glucosylceramidase 4 n=1 Tax=Homalodisca vitripennis TaxID=197043 RepID=UPI001EEC68D9|nr:putative glucosylceramidase 4 [Homalodisca vitripennis]
MEIRLRYLFIFTLVKLAITGDIPCSARLEQYGYICVCNETYCDTVERPSQLPRGQYYHYMTSEDSPGFTKTVGTFLNISDTSNISSDVYISVNSDLQYQTFVGVGASFTDSSGMLFHSLPLGVQNKFVESFFGSSGLEYTLVRVPVACSDFSTRPYSYDDVPGDMELKYFNLTQEDYILKIPLIKMAQNASTRGLKLVATPWTAPFWMKSNNSTQPGYLHSQYYRAWSNYILKFFEAYNEQGIEFWGLTQGNEFIVPIYFGAFFIMPNMIMLPSQARYWTKAYLGPILRTSDYKHIKILTLDDERPFMSWWSDRMFTDKEAAHYIDGIALHWYFDNNRSISELEQFNKKYPDKFILYTESSINTFQSGGSAVSLGDWSRAVRYINNVFQNFGHWVVGYVDWNIALDESGGPTGPSKVPLEASVIINATRGEFYKQPIFYVLGHFSKFIQPGAKRIDVTISQDSISAHGKKFQGEMNVSTTASPFPTRKPDPPSNVVLALATKNPDSSYTLIVYNPRAVPANVIVNDNRIGTFNQTVPPHSLNSFVYW